MTKDLSERVELKTFSPFQFYFFLFVGGGCAVHYTARFREQVNLT